MQEGYLLTVQQHQVHILSAVWLQMDLQFAVLVHPFLSSRASSLGEPLSAECSVFFQSEHAKSFHYLTEPHDKGHPACYARYSVWVIPW